MIVFLIVIFSILLIFIINFIDNVYFRQFNQDFFDFLPMTFQFIGLAMYLFTCYYFNKNFFDWTELDYTFVKLYFVNDIDFYISFSKYIFKNFLITDFNLLLKLVTFSASENILACKKLLDSNNLPCTFFEPLVAFFVTFNIFSLIINISRSSVIWGAFQTFCNIFVLIFLFPFLLVLLFFSFFPKLDKRDLRRIWKDGD